MAKKNKYKKGELLMKVIINGNPEQAEQLLKNKTGQTAQNFGDLELKLSKMYLNSPDKKEIEKKLAEIHPHKDFILKTLAPKIEQISAPQPQVEAVKHIQEVQEMANAEGYLGQAINNPAAPHIQNPYKDNTGIVIGVIGVVAIIATIGLMGFMMVNMKKLTNG